MNSRVFGGMMTPWRPLPLALRALVVQKLTFSTSALMIFEMSLKMTFRLAGSSSLRAATKASSIAQLRE